LAKRLTKAARQHFEIREAFKGLCELINEAKLIPTRENNDEWEGYEDDAKLSGAMLLYRKLYRIEIETEAALREQDAEGKEGGS
jgi:hypothetical protein